MNPQTPLGALSSGLSNAFPDPNKIQPLLSQDDTGAFDNYRSNLSDVKTPSALYQLANSVGLGKDADRVINNAGGESGKYMSGGFIMDSMDLLNTFQYGFAGMLKGKTFMQGVDNRDSLSDEDALGKYGWMGKVAGFAADIIIDPLTYIAPEKLAMKIPGVAKGIEYGSKKMFGELNTITVEGQKFFNREGGWTPLTFLADKLVYGSAVDRSFLDGVQKKVAQNASLSEEATGIIKTMNDLTPDVFDNTLTKDSTGRMVSKNLSDVEIDMRRAGQDKEFETVKNMYDLRDSLMKKLVDLNVISKETADEHWGSYLKQSYDEYLSAKDVNKVGKGGVAIKSPSRVADLTPEAMADLGQVTNPGILWGTTLLKQIDLVKKAELQDYINKGYAITSDLLDQFEQKGGDVKNLVRVPENKTYSASYDANIAKTDTEVAASKARASGKDFEKFVQSNSSKTVEELTTEIPDRLAELQSAWDKVSTESNLYGPLAGKWVSKELWNAVKGSFEPSKELGENLVLSFKHVKTVWSPASFVRNGLSATVQNWWKMGLGPWRVDVYYNASREFKTNGKYLREMKDLGFHEKSGYLSELLDNYLTNKELMQKSLVEQLGDVNSVKKYFKHVDRLLTNSYGHTDNIAKVAAYMHGVKHGLSKEESYSKAMAATFNYSEITPFVQQMRKAVWGVPFITFALKAAPLVGETLAKNPGRISVFGKARNDLFKAAGVDGQQEQETMPAYMRDDMFMLKLPWKDSKNRSMYFDLTYILPFGALADGSYLKDPISANPVLQFVREVSQNKTFGGSKIFRESDDTEKVVADIAIHALKLGLPPTITDFTSDGYKEDGSRQPSKMGWERLAGLNTNDLGAGERTFYQTTFKTLGINAMPYNIDSQKSALAYRQKDNLTKLLTENGVLKTYTSGYLPKDSPVRPGNGALGDPSNPGNLYDKEVRPYGR